MFTGEITKPIRILQVHNRYYSGLGGEDSVVALELEMLRKRGHEVEQLLVSTSDLKDAHPFKILNAALSTPWSVSSYRMVQRAIARFRPDVVHFHNTFPLLSPSVHWAAHEARTAVVQTLHNYRMVCASGSLLLGDEPCEECFGKIAVPALRHKCYKDSFLATFPVVAMQAVHRFLGTAHKKVDAFIALTEFAKAKMVQAGLPPERIFVKPNFAVDQAHTKRESNNIRQFAFLGKIFRYKGLDLLLEAWERLDDPNAKLVIAGEGPAKAELEHRFPGSDRVAWLGWQDQTRAAEIVDQSHFLVLPSRALEGFPMVLVEALSAGTPSIVPRHGAFPQLVSDGRDGILFEPRDVDSLTSALTRSLQLSRPEWLEMSERCIRKYREFYTEEANYRVLLEIYERAIRSRMMEGFSGQFSDGDISGMAEKNS